MGSPTQAQAEVIIANGSITVLGKLQWMILVGASMLVTPRKVEEILSRGYKDDFDMTLELEWNTQQWGTAEIEAACDVLVSEAEAADDTPAGAQRRKHCLQMIEKLLQRHRDTGTYMVKNIEVFVQKALANVRMKDSKFQNLIHLICLLARHFPEHLNALNIVTRLLKLLMAEVELGKHCGTPCTIVERSEPHNVAFMSRTCGSDTNHSACIPAARRAAARRSKRVQRWSAACRQHPHG